MTGLPNGSGRRASLACLHSQVLLHEPWSILGGYPFDMGQNLRGLKLTTRER